MQQFIFATSCQRSVGFDLTWQKYLNECGDVRNLSVTKNGEHETEEIINVLYHFVPTFGYRE